MKANWDYYNHKYYNYDYEDMAELSLSDNRDENTQITSSIYPTKLEVKIDEDYNRPYLCYEGIVQTNKGPARITFPRLDLVINTMEIKSYTNDVERYDITAPFGRVWIHSTPEYEMTTKFSNNDVDGTMFELKMFGEDDYMSVKAHFDRRWGK